MKRLFIHQPLFRLLSPFFSGIIVYLLVLLLNNNVAQIQEEFFNDELYFCIGLCYLIQEFSRLLLLLFKRLLNNKISLVLISTQILISMLLCIVLSTFAITLYFRYVLNFEATKEEIYVFNTIFCSITLVYILLYVSHQYLYKINTEKLVQEELIKKNIEEEFKQFKRGINPNLLFQSLETLLILIKNDKEKSDDFLDNLASIYRYILSAKNQQLVSFSEEILVLKNLELIINELPFTKININNTVNTHFLLVPGALLHIVEQIVRTTIKSDETLAITIENRENDFNIAYKKSDSILYPFKEKLLQDIFNTYSVYSDIEIQIIEDEFIRKIVIPKLEIKN